MPEVGERFLGTVVKTTTFGAFISLLPGKDGLLHISEVRKLVGGKRIDAVEDVLTVGQKVQVELKEIDPRGKLSLAAVLPDDESSEGGDDSRGPRRSSDGDGQGDDEGHDDGHGDSHGDGGGRRGRRRRRHHGRREDSGDGSGAEDASAGSDAPPTDVPPDDRGPAPRGRPLLRLAEHDLAILVRATLGSVKRCDGRLGRVGVPHG